MSTEQKGEEEGTLNNHMECTMRVKSEHTNTIVLVCEDRSENKRAVISSLGIPGVDDGELDGGVLCLLYLLSTPSSSADPPRSCLSEIADR